MLDGCFGGPVATSPLQADVVGLYGLQGVYFPWLMEEQSPFILPFPSHSFLLSPSISLLFLLTSSLRLLSCPLTFRCG